MFKQCFLVYASVLFYVSYGIIVYGFDMSKYLGYCFWFKNHGSVLKHLGYIGLFIFKVFIQYVYGNLCSCCFCKLLGFVSMCL